MSYSRIFWDWVYEQYPVEGGFINQYVHRVYDLLHGDAA